MSWRTVGAVVGAAASVLVITGAVVALRPGELHPARLVNVSGLPAPPTGQRWVDWHGVAVEVPHDWGYGSEPDDQWCADNGDETPSPSTPAPYVALDPSYGFHSEVRCRNTEHHDPAFGPAPESLWADHVALLRAGSPDGIWHDDGWTLTSKTIAGVQVKVLTRDSAAGDVEATSILDSATPVTTDQNGCAASSPIQASAHVRPDPVDLDSVHEVDAVSICQYGRPIPASDPGLIASHVMTGTAATTYFQALTAAPTGGGPNVPQDCIPQEDDGTAIVIRLWTGTASHDLYAYYDWCRDNGIDDGTYLRALTQGTCSPLFTAPPVTLWSFDQHLSSRCL